MPRIKFRNDTHQDCSTCGKIKPYEEFYRDKHSINGVSYSCKTCMREYDAKYRTTEKYRIKVRRQKWRDQGIKITYDEYKIMLAAQDGKCAICERTVNQFGKGMCVDHDHATGAVRGILCTDCNMGIGNLKDDVRLVRKALKYLEVHMLRAVS